LFSFIPQLDYIIFWTLSFILSFVTVSPIFPQICENCGYLKIETDLPGIEIQLNSKLLGTTPLPIIALPLGEYQLIALHPERYLWGNLDWHDSIEVTAHDTIVIKPKFQWILNIRSQPFDAEVYLNDEFKGKTPLTISLASKKDTHLMLKKKGYKNYLINLDQIENNFLNVKLVEDHLTADFKLVGASNEKIPQKSYRKITYSLWGLSVISGLTAIYFKKQADMKYRQYLVTGSLNDMNRLYQESQKFDQYTLFSLGIMQGALALSVYFFMKSTN